MAILSFRYYFRILWQKALTLSLVWQHVLYVTDSLGYRNLNYTNSGAASLKQCAQASLEDLRTPPPMCFHTFYKEARTL